MLQDVLSDAEDRMKKTVEALSASWTAIRTGHAHVGLVDHVRVEYFGTDDAGEPDGDRGGARGALADDPALGPQRPRGDREGAAQVGHRADAFQRWRR